MPHFPWHRPRIKKKWKEVDRKWGEELVRRWRRQWCLQKLAIQARWEEEDEKHLAENEFTFEEADAADDADVEAASLGFDADADADADAWMHNAHHGHPSAEQGRSRQSLAHFFQYSIPCMRGVRPHSTVTMYIQACHD